jgi:hypothetical protein
MVELSRFQVQQEPKETETTSSNISRNTINNNNNDSVGPEVSRFNLSALYEQLAVFVTEHSNYKLRLVHDNQGDPDANEAAAEDFDAPFIHLQVLDVEAELFISSKQEVRLKNSSLLTTAQQAESFLRDLPGEDKFDWLETGDASGVEAFLLSVEGGCKQRMQLMVTIDALMIPEGFYLALSPTEASSLVLEAAFSGQQLLAQVDWVAGSVIWSDAGRSNHLEEINAVALKYRSVIDCLQCQLELLFEKLK